MSGHVIDLYEHLERSVIAAREKAWGPLASGSSPEAEAEPGEAYTRLITDVGWEEDVALTIRDLIRELVDQALAARGIR